MKIHPLQAGRVLILLTNQEAGRLGLLNRELSEKQYRLICARLLREVFRYLHRAPFPGMAQARSVLLPGGEMLFWFLLPPLNPHSVDFWFFILCAIVVILVINAFQAVLDFFTGRTGVVLDTPRFKRKKKNAET